jgi:pimeloyl-ACP methyl ester carboxylesterase
LAKLQINEPVIKMLERKFITLSHGNLHYRIGGNGKTAIILLHASPRTSEMMVSFANLLTDTFTVIAPDTPGYGLSDGLSQEPESLKDYVFFIKELMQQLGYQRFMIYGTATGAQLGICYANQYPEDVIHLFADNAAHFTDEEKDDILKFYFPDISPKDDGSHLETIWKMAQNMSQFFPWFQENEEYRIGANAPSAEILNTLMVEYLNAGANYWWAYKAAFEHEKASNVQKLSIPTTIFRWEGGMLLKFVDKLLVFELPKNVQIINTPPPILERYKRMAEWIKQTQV